MSEERSKHPQEPAEGSEEDVEVPGAEKARDAGDDVPEEAPQPDHPDEPAEGADEDVEAPGAERAGDGG